VRRTVVNMEAELLSSTSIDDFGKAGDVS
jgi:hypothetical protein